MTYPGQENDLSKRAKRIHLRNYLDKNMRGIGASTKMGIRKAVIQYKDRFYGSKALAAKVTEAKFSLLKTL